MSLRSSIAFVLSVITLLAQPAYAAVGAWCDPTSTLAVLDGVIVAGDYPGSSVGVGSSFGGMIGAGVPMYLDSDASGNLAFGIDATGHACAWGPDDSVVIYLDSIPAAGFADTSTLTDNADGGRAAASGMGTDGSRATLTFAAGFGADYAIVLRADSATLFRLQAGGAHTFVRSLSRAPAAGFDTACVREAGGISMSDLGSEPGNPLRWVATLLNASNAIRSNEFNSSTAAIGTMNIGAAPFSLAAGDRNTFESFGPPLAMRAAVPAWTDFGTANGTGFTPTPSCGQLSSNSWAATGFGSGNDLVFGGTKTTTNYANGASAGGVGAGGFYAFTVAVNDVALGIQPATGSYVPGTITLRLQNLGTTVITGAAINFNVLYRNDSPRSTTVAFAWSTDGTTFTNIAGLLVTTPLAADTGTIVWTSNPRSTSLSALAIPPGSYLFLRFSGADNGGTLGRDELAFDDITVTPTFNTCGNGVVDGGETCDSGASNATPTSCCLWTCMPLAADTSCGGGGLGGCDLPDTCDAIGNCVDRVITMGTECRSASGGPCDRAESCDGIGHACPADGVLPLNTVCAAADPTALCDLDDVCDGSSAACATRIADSGSTCRLSSSLCDLGASCDGITTTCPASTAAGMGSPCRPSVGLCDVPEACDGIGLGCPLDMVLMMGMTCRPSTGTCDAPEACDGMTGACPMDFGAPDGTACDDSLSCNGHETCMSGTCLMGMVPTCDDANLCTSDSCAEPAGCAHSMLAGCCNLSTECDDGNVCTVDTCSGPGGSCSSSPITNCCTSNAQCADTSACTTDSCNLATHQCAFTPIPGCCGSISDCDDGNVCTTDACGAGGTCSNSMMTGCCQTAGDCDDANACTADSCRTDHSCAHDAIATCCSTAADCNDGDACTTDRCNAATVRCAADPISCDDSNACTTDSCESGTCHNTPIACDAGVGDAGSTSDAGTDAGNIPADASMLDAGMGDGGTVMTAGGCGCRTAEPRSTTPTWALVLVGVLVVLRRRVRRAYRIAR